MQIDTSHKSLGLFTTKLETSLILTLMEGPSYISRPLTNKYVNSYAKRTDSHPRWAHQTRQYPENISMIFIFIILGKQVLYLQVIIQHKLTSVQG